MVNNCKNQSKRNKVNKRDKNLVIQGQPRQYGQNIYHILIIMPERTQSQRKNFDPEIKYATLFSVKA